MVLIIHPMITQLKYVNSVWLPVNTMFSYVGWTVHIYIAWTIIYIHTFLFTEEVSRCPTKTCQHCGHICAIGYKLCPGCKGEFPLSKKRQAIGPPKSCPTNLISIMQKKVCVEDGVILLSVSQCIRKHQYKNEYQFAKNNTFYFKISDFRD